jgi:hypothetical protein
MRLTPWGRLLRNGWRGTRPHDEAYEDDDRRAAIVCELQGREVDGRDGAGVVAVHELSHHIGMPRELERGSGPTGCIRPPQQGQISSERPVSSLYRSR